MRNRLRMGLAIGLAAALGAANVRAAGNDENGVLCGIDVLQQQGFSVLQGKRVGLITNATGIDRNWRSTVDILHEAKDVKLVTLYGPEHGVRGANAAGAHVDNATDDRTGLPVYSLYGKHRRPAKEMLEGVEVLVFDIQDIGSRSFTFISTMAICMEAAAENDIEFVVLDRPNPLGGERVEGRPLDMKYQSFVGQLPIPYVHGLTVGELAQMANGEGWLKDGLKCKLTVVPMKGWKRDMLFSETGLVWVPPSPHIPRSESSAFYAATGIMGELRIFSEGVGYPLPFELAGVPGLDADKFAAELNKRDLPGVRFRPQYYTPYYASYEKEVVGGVQIYLTSPKTAPLTPIQFHIMDYWRANGNKDLFGGKRDAMFDKVCGTDQIRAMFLAGKPIDEILAFWSEGVDGFKKDREQYLMYK